MVIQNTPHKRRPDTNGLPEDWQKQLEATPMQPWVLDNRSEGEKRAQERLINAQAVESEQKNWRRKLQIGWTHTWRSVLTFGVGFALGNIFQINVW